MKSLIQPKVIKVLNVFSIGVVDNCQHDWIYDKPSIVTFTYPSVVIQDRICECCGRFEKVHIEGNQAKYESDKFNKLKEN